ncbi:MAG: 4-hydroxy-tetrahydrodipicolinate reductase [Clostridia bacterium]|nr:4-hydroxy-tetrahydrodipicolinate reductase [Clostridia bacterium]
MRILLSGLNGHMGKEVVALARQGCRGANIVAGVDFLNTSGNIPCAGSFEYAEADVDCVIDFSHHSCTGKLLEYAIKNRLPLVIATTGQTEEEKKMISDASDVIPIFYAANFSIGIALLIEMAKKAASVLPEAEIEIVEVHHDRKLDAPSGTALAIANALQTVRADATFKAGRNGAGKREKNEIGISSVRMGNIVGIHEVMICTSTQTITLKHEAHSRALFAEGALAAADFICGKTAGLYGMSDMIKI